MLLFHTIELMLANRHPMPVQAIYKQVPVFQAMPSVLRMRAPTTEISAYLQGANKREWHTS